jgi:hypothetical protein
MIHTLPNLVQSKAQREAIAHSILAALGNQQDLPFYRLVATKIPERVIRYALTELKAEGARFPERVFAYRMQKYALDQHKQSLVDKTARTRKK